VWRQGRDRSGLTLLREQPREPVPVEGRNAARRSGLGRVPQCLGIGKLRLLGQALRFQQRLKQPLEPLRPGQADTGFPALYRSKAHTCASRQLTLGSPVRPRKSSSSPRNWSAWIDSEDDATGCFLRRVTPTDCSWICRGAQVVHVHVVRRAALHTVHVGAVDRRRSSRDDRQANAWSTRRLPRAKVVIEGKSWGSRRTVTRAMPGASL
jgi:hypothetical protein